MAERLFRLLNIVDSWLFPEKITCLCCDSALGDDEQDGLCPGCTQALARLGGVFQTAPPPAGIHSAFAAFPYADQPRKLILMLKFESVRAAALPLAQAMSALPLGESDALVPVPTTRRRLRQRGFNQARLLAEHLGEIWGMPVLPALSRKDEHTAQMKLSAESRRSNLADCMRSRRLRQRKTHPACGRRADHRFHRVRSRAGAAGCRRMPRQSGYGRKNHSGIRRSALCPGAGYSLFRAGRRAVIFRPIRVKNRRP